MGIIIAGTSGLATECAVTIESTPHYYGAYNGCFGPDSFIDDVRPILKPYLGDDKDIGKYLKSNAVIIGIGNPKVKKMIVEKLDSLYPKKVRYCRPLIHDRAIAGLEYNNVGKGTVIQPIALLTCDVEVGNHVMINQLVSVGLGTKIGDYCTISPHAAISGDVILGEGVWVGSGAVIREGITVGSNVIIGANAAVVKDVPEGETIVGVPAKPLHRRGDIVATKKWGIHPSIKHCFERKK